MSSIEQAVKLIKASSRVAVATHVSPDPDAIGSLLGLGLALRSLGKEVALLCDDPAPAKLRFLPGSDGIASSTDLQADLFIGLDSSDPQRLGQCSADLLAGGIPIINIDHHVTNLDFGAVNLVDARAASTSEALLPLLDALEVELTLDIAACLAAGLIGDTRSFSTSNVTANTFLTAARLIEAGIDLATIIEIVFNRRSLSLLRLWGLGLANLIVEDRVIWTVVPLAAQREAGLPEIGDTGLSNLLISADEAKIAAVFTEQSDGKIDISFRARPGYDVAGVALSLGGGGHTLASGCLIEGPLDQAINRVVPLLKQQTASPEKKG